MIRKGKRCNLPLKSFICPDNQAILVDDCLKEGGCRCGERCATRAYLHLAASDREWKGIPSTTMLIQGTLCSFLKITKEYSVQPYERAFMIHGLKGHANLENQTDEMSLLEYKFEGKSVTETGIADVIEIENGETTLADYKTWGSYKLSKALGFSVVDVPTDEVYKSGK
jgi:hypothetical protein